MRLPAKSGCPSFPRIVRRRRGLLVGASAIAIAATSAAQDTQSSDGTFSVQTLHPGPGPRNFLQTRGARTDGDLAFSAGFLTNYGQKPFVIRSCRSMTDCSDPNAAMSTDINVVEHILTTDFMGSLTVVPWLQIGVRVPLTYVEGDGFTDDGFANFEQPVDNFALGDVELEGKFRIFGEVDSPLVIGAAGFVGFPTGAATGGDQTYVGDNVFSGGVRAILDANIVEGLRAAANLTYFARGDARVGSTDLGMDFRFSGALSYEITPIFSVLADAWGTTRFDTANGSNTLEAAGGVEFTPLNSGVYIKGAFGGGILQGVGTPDFRGMLGVTYVHEAMDEDGDGLTDDADQCPTIAEDEDGYQDDDGCPETDNDEDGIADENDKCPDLAEDLDKFEDNDGCPELDNDKDGLPDLADRCPNEPENKNGFEDEDGCPDVPDRDSDGVPDDKDKCPEEAEDTDGFADTDGCPDPDNDGDGIPDDEDECVDEPETINEFQDKDGCPDEAP